VTSFSVESYQLLTPSSSSPKPTSSVIRINVFWFSSLSLSLTTVLLGTTCMKWLREYRHYDPLTHKGALLLRHMRYDGLIEWKVPVILSLLPTLLEAALVLFIGLLHRLNETVAIIVSITIGSPMIFNRSRPPFNISWTGGKTSVSPAVRNAFTNPLNLGHVSKSRSITCSFSSR